MKFFTLKTLLILSCLLHSISNYAQFEIGGFIGVAQYQGDLAENDIELEETLLSKGIFLRFHPHPSFTIKASYYNATISGDDKNAVAEIANRGWRFSTIINEFSVKGEWNILRINRQDRYGQRFKPHFTPIIFTGVGVTFTDPNLFIPADFDFSTLAVPVPEPNNTNTFFSLPLGVALRYDFSPFTVLGLEGGTRIIFSDYLDNVSENGNNKAQDLYLFIGLNLSFFFGHNNL